MTSHHIFKKKIHFVYSFVNENTTHANICIISLKCDTRFLRDMMNSLQDGYPVLFLQHTAFAEVYKGRCSLITDRSAQREEICICLRTKLLFLLLITNTCTNILYIKFARKQYECFYYIIPNRIITFVMNIM